MVFQPSAVYTVDATLVVECERKLPIGLKPPSLRVPNFVAPTGCVLCSAASCAPVLGLGTLRHRRPASLFVLFAGIPIGVIGHTPLTRPTRVKWPRALLVAVTRCVAPSAGVRRRIHLKPDQALLFISEPHGLTVKRAHAINSVLLHESDGCIVDIVRSVHRASFGDANGIVHLNPLRSKSAGVVGVCVLNVL